MTPVSSAFLSAFDEKFLPLLKQLGMARTKPKRVKPGLITAAATRSIGELRRIEATLWCDADRGTNLRFRFDVVEPINGVECTRQVELTLPWPDPAYPKPRTLDSSGKDFLPEKSPERLATAISFLAGAFAASLTSTQELPELSQDLQTAASTAEWKAAIERAKGLWATRHSE